MRSGKSTLVNSLYSWYHEDYNHFLGGIIQIEKACHGVYHNKYRI